MATTINDVITEVDELKPNVYDDELKIKWLKDLDLRIYDEIILSHQNQEITIDSDTEYDVNTELIADAPYSELYKFYLFAQIDFFNNETERYANSMIMFNQKYRDFAAYYNRTHRPLISVLDLF